MKKIMLAFVLGAIVPANAQVQVGIDVMEKDHFSLLQKMVVEHHGSLRAGLLTNQTGLDAEQRRTVDVLYKDAAKAVLGFSLAALFSPEHGLYGKLDREGIANDKDEATGLEVSSLYGVGDSSRRPTEEQLKGLDVLIVDLQDAGVRYYTYQSVLGYFVEAAARFHKELIILDRPDPLGGELVQGPSTTAGRESYISYFAEPVRQGMTLGELATLFNGEKHLRARLTVVKMEGWKRRQWFDETGVLWKNPSPNLRSVLQNTVYSGVGLLETSNVSVGRGTDTPFLLVGAPWVQATVLARYLNERRIDGVSFTPVTFTPDGDPAYPYNKKKCEGIEIELLNRDRLDGPELGVEIASALWTLYPKDFELAKIDKILLQADTLHRIQIGEDPRYIAKSWSRSLNDFKGLRKKYLLY